MDPKSSYNTFLNERQKKSLRRFLPSNFTTSMGQEKDPISYASNDYMQLSRHPIVAAACTKALHTWGLSGGSSRILQEEIPLCEQLEKRLARDLGMEAALTFVSGYQTNATTLAALLDARVLKRTPLVFCDRLIHASLHHGVKLAGAIPKRYRHQDMDHLAQLLAATAQDPAPKFVVTESVFSMEGTLTPMPSLVEVCQKYGAFLFLDEAHALGACGEKGHGLGAGIVDPDNTLLMGTFTKGLGCGGAYVAGPQEVIDYLTNACTGLIYTTAPSPVLLAGALAAWNLVPHMGEERARIYRLASHLTTGLHHRGFTTPSHPCHIIPLILGGNEVTLEAKKRLEQRGIRTSAIRPPTVPLGTARLRFGLHSELTEAHIEATLRALDQGVMPLIVRPLQGRAP